MDNRGKIPTLLMQTVTGLANAVQPFKGLRRKIIPVAEDFGSALNPRVSNADFSSGTTNLLEQRDQNRTHQGLPLEILDHQPRMMNASRFNFLFEGSFSKAELGLLQCNQKGHWASGSSTSLHFTHIWLNILFLHSLP